MVSTKSQLTFLVFTLAVVVVAVNATSMHIGRRQPGDGLVCYGDVNLQAQYGKTISAQRICNVPRYNQTITYIVAFDTGKPGKGGYARIVQGGLNQKTVTVSMQSQLNQPLNFTLQVYAKPFY